MSDTIHARGTIHGQTIELEQPVSLEEGEVVNIMISRASHDVAEKLPPGEGFRRSAGAWADDAEEVDEFLEWNRQQRKLSRPEIEP
jgi:hypothetical protein